MLVTYRTLRYNRGWQGLRRLEGMKAANQRWHPVKQATLRYLGIAHFLAVCWSYQFSQTEVTRMDRHLLVLTWTNQLRLHDLTRVKLRHSELRSRGMPTLETILTSQSISRKLIRLHGIIHDSEDCRVPDPAALHSDPTN